MIYWFVVISWLKAASARGAGWLGVVIVLLLIVASPVVVAALTAVLAPVLLFIGTAEAMARLWNELRR